MFIYLVIYIVAYFARQLIKIEVKKRCQSNLQQAPYHIVVKDIAASC